MLTRVIVDVPEEPAGIERVSGLADMVKSGVVDMTCDGADTRVVTVIPAKSVRSRQRGNDASLMDNTNTRLADALSKLDFRFQYITVEHNHFTILLAMVAESLGPKVNPAKVTFQLSFCEYVTLCLRSRGEKSRIASTSRWNPRSG